MKIHETLLQWQVPLWANAECKNLTWTVGAFLQSQRTELAADDTNSNTSPRVNQGLLSACDFSKTGSTATCPCTCMQTRGFTKHTHGVSLGLIAMI